LVYPLGKRVTIQMADELAERRKKFTFHETGQATENSAAV